MIGGTQTSRIDFRWCTTCVPLPTCLTSVVLWFRFIFPLTMLELIA